VRDIRSWPHEVKLANGSGRNPQSGHGRWVEPVSVEGKYNGAPQAKVSTELREGTAGHVLVRSNVDNARGADTAQVRWYVWIREGSGEVV
jgi:hypothetical protein